MIKSIEKLREVADEIEREIAERYMELPVDADGVPIHCGDRMRLDNGYDVVFDIMMSDHTCFDWAKSRHVKPRTLEDILQCAGVSVAAIEDVAAEIREMMEAGE